MSARRVEMYATLFSVGMYATLCVIYLVCVSLYDMQVTTLANIGGNLNGPYGIVIDFAGVNLFVTCLTANSIRQVVISTGSVRTLTTAGVSPFLQPKYASRILLLIGF